VKVAFTVILSQAILCIWKYFYLGVLDFDFIVYVQRFRLNLQETVLSNAASPRSGNQTVPTKQLYQFLDRPGAGSEFWILDL